MSRREKIGGRHSSAGCDRFIEDAARGALVTLGGARISFGRVVAVSSKSHRPGTWKRRGSVAMGGVPVVLYGDSKSVQAVVFVAANDNGASR